MEQDMRNLLLSICILLLPGYCALGQSYNMKVHLKTGATVTIPIDSIGRVVFSQTTGVQDPAASHYAPTTFRLLQNYPNPFNPSTTIVYEIARTSDVNVRIFDMKGSLIRDLVHEAQVAGQHRVSWDGTDNSRVHVSSGVYFSVVQCGEQVLSRRLILIK
jgi:hypothetical protein